jgi:beta-phosphoglucomutase-like phosphatase (HAD superfamily)
VSEEVDAADMAAWLKRQKWWMWDGDEEQEIREGRMMSQAIELYRKERARELAYDARKAAERARQDEMWAEAARTRKRAAELAERMRHMRRWGPENGFFVGTRGRIPKAVVKAYNEAMGIHS